MLGFSPFKKHANKFNYVPRYYDPEKEERQKRRAELRGERPEDAHSEYRPGQYIRTQREARAQRQAEQGAASGRARMWKIFIVIALVMAFIYILYPRLADVFIRAKQTQKPQTEWSEYDNFDPTAPITIVPNDYKEE